MSRDAETGPEDHPTLTPTSARQGMKGRHILVILVVATTLAAAGMFAAWAWKAPGLARPGSQQSVGSKAGSHAFHAPEPQPIVPQPNQDHTSPGPGSRPDRP